MVAVSLGDEYAVQCCTAEGRTTCTLAGLWPLGGMAERVGDAIAEGGAEFHRLRSPPRQEQTLLAPELPPDGGEGIGDLDGPLALAVPAGHGDPRPAGALVSQDIGE